jgi:hypothetical protein
VKVQERRLLIAISYLQIALQVLFSGEGSDISASRTQFLNGNKSDFFGTFANQFYSLIPDFFLKWFMILTLLQCALVSFALSKIYKTISWTKLRFFLMLITQSVLLAFSSQQSRDGTLFSFVFFGISIFYISQKRGFGSLQRSNQTWYVVGAVFTCIGLAFRPWMSFSLLPIMLSFKYQKTIKIRVAAVIPFILSLLIFLFSPILIETTSTKLFSAKPGYAFQLVIIHDLSSAACWSANSGTVSSALETLKKISTNENFETAICQFYKPNTWQAVAFEYEKGPLTNGLEVPLRLTQSGSEYNYLLKNWLSIILKDPKTYFQNKLMISTQVFFASQGKVGFVLPFESGNSVTQFIQQALLGVLKIFYIPWIIASKLYVLTPGFFILLYFFSRLVLPRKSNYILSSTGFFVVVSAFTLSTFLFVSDNARYTTTYVLLGYLISLPRLFNKRRVRED